MIDSLIATATHTRSQTLKLVADLTDDQLSIQPAPKTNHPAWVLGHLLLTENASLNFIDPSCKLPDYITDSYRGIYSSKSVPLPDKTRYLPKQFYVDEFLRLRPQLIAAVKSMTPEQWGAPHPDPARRERFNSLGHFIVHILTWHEAYHAGQLSAWRRVQGLPPV